MAWRRLLAMSLVAIFVGAARAGAATTDPDRAPDRAYVALSSGSVMEDKDFYLLTLFGALPAVHAALAADEGLQEEARARRAALADARTHCNKQTACLVQALLMPEAEISRTADLIVARLDKAGLLAGFARDHLRASGRFARFQTSADADLVRQAWEDGAHAMNHILHVYGLGEAPLYPLLDSASYPPGDAMWKDAVNDFADVTLDEPHDAEMFYSLPLSAALDMLTMNDRDEPARMEPLDKGENAAALSYAAHLDWRKWRYPVILIPGRSPVLKDNPLSPEAKMKMRLAARRYRDGWAPLIVVSGGYCFPSQTRFNEALEMKRELMRRYAIPERAILIDPFARHTTTNLRNTERLLFEAGAPLERPVMVTTTAYQSQYMEGQVFHDRCLRELGYACFSDLKRVSLFDTELRLPSVSLHRDAADPLDP